MVRRRTAALSSSVAALLLAAPLITSCAEHPGTAAVVGGSKISVATVQAQVTRIRDAQSAAGERVSLAGGNGGLDRYVLHKLIGYRVLDDLAARYHVTVTQAQIDAAASAQARNFGSAKGLREALLSQGGIAPGEPTQAYLRSLVEQKGVARALGVTPGTAQGQARLNTVISDAFAAAHVDVNPRYGTWKAPDITDATSPWLHPAVPAQQAALTG